MLGKIAWSVLLLASVSGCTPACRKYDCFGADEFVIDSYQIRQGKLAILEMSGIEVGELSESDLEEYPDAIAEDDLLQLSIFHPSRHDVMEAVECINGRVGFRVSEGRLALPQIPPVIVEGLTLEEAKIKIERAYRDQIQDIEVFLSYRDRLSHKIELAGAVARASLPIDGKTRLYEVLAEAKVASDANFFKSYVLREGVQLAIDMHRLMHAGDLSQNIVMRPGDKVFIAGTRDSTVMVMGEVGSPMAVPVPSGSISLREALVTAGGIPFTGDKSAIQVIRGNLRYPKIYALSWEHILHLPNDSLLLMPGDTIYVSEKPITQWNRFIDQLFPSFNAFQTAHGSYRILNPPPS